MKIEDLVFWLVAAIIIAIATWTLFGSPGIEEVAFMIALGVLGEIFLLHREFFLFKGKTESKLEHIEKDLEYIKNNLHGLEYRGK